MKLAQVTTLALLGLLTAVMLDPAAAKPGNGRGGGNRPTAETVVDVEETAEDGRGNRPAGVSEVEAEEDSNEYRPTESVEEFEEEIGEAGGRTPGSLPPGIQQRVNRGEGLPSGIQRRVNRGEGLPPGWQR